jgi:hypothetical protein
VATAACGWEISDVLRMLEERGHSLDGLRGVERTTPFDGTISFETDDQARSVAAELVDERIHPSLRAAAEIVEVRDRDVRVRFSPVDEMSVHAVGEDHHTACILHRDGPPSDAA